MKILSAVAFAMALVTALCGIFWIDYHGARGAVLYFSLAVICVLGGIGISMLSTVHAKLDKIEKQLRNRGRNLTAEEIVDSLRQEGLIDGTKALSDAEILEFLNK